MRLIVNEEIGLPEWDDFLSKGLFSSPFQSVAFYNAYRSSESSSADVFAIVDGNEIVALTVVTIQYESGLKKYFSRRGIIFGGPVVQKNKSNALRKLLNEVSHFYKGKGIIYLETRNLFDYTHYKDDFIISGWSYAPYLNFHLQCENIDKAWQNLNRRRRREIRIARESGVKIETAETTDDLHALYRIIADAYKTRIKKPLPPFELFKSLFNQNVCRVFLVKYDDDILGGTICLTHNDKILYLWYGSAIVDENNKFFPLVMTFWGAIEFGVLNGYKYIDFMGAGKPDEEYAVRDFKSRFGGTMVEHGRFLKIGNPLLYHFGSLAIKYLARLFA